MKKIGLVVIGLMASATLQSCGVAMSAGAGLGGLGLSNGHFFESEEDCKTKSYPQYLKDMQTVNQEQVKQHLTSSKTETIEEYCHIKEAEKTINNKTDDNHG